MKHNTAHVVPYHMMRSTQDRPILLTCEHASQEFPLGWSLAKSDQWLEDTLGSVLVGFAKA